MYGPRSKGKYWGRGWSKGKHRPRAPPPPLVLPWTPGGVVPGWTPALGRPAMAPSGNPGVLEPGPPGFWGPGPLNVGPYARPVRTTREPEPGAPRWDIQGRKRKEPASQHLAREAAWMISRGELQPKEELQRDKFAPTTRGPKNARRAFVENLVSIAEQGGGVYPLTSDKLQNQT